MIFKTYTGEKHVFLSMFYLIPTPSPSSPHTHTQKKAKWEKVTTKLELQQIEFASEVSALEWTVVYNELLEAYTNSVNAT